MYHGPLRTTTPATRVNDDLELVNKYHSILNAHADKFVNKTYCHPLIHQVPNDQHKLFYCDFLNQALVYIVTETVGEYPYPYFSEKTWKAMLAGVPFMIVGGKHSLQTLQSIGFKTFSHWWSEDYDSLPTVAERIEAIVYELKKLSELNHASLISLKQEMWPTLQHNFEHLNVFRNNDLNNIKKNI
jgi:hypothetical protein